MRFSCKSCQATFQTATNAPASASFRCPSCNGEMAIVAEVVELWQDRIPTRRYDLDDLRARLDLEREEFARARGAPRSADQIWFAAVQGRQVGPLSAAGISGLRARGQLSAASLVWREGWPSWVAAEAVPELRAILGLPEEKPGQPFPVQPADPAPPPFDSTYAAARARGTDEHFADPRLQSEKTDPDAHLPEELRRSFAPEERATAPGAALRDEAGTAPLVPRAPPPARELAPASAPAELPPPPPAISPVPPLAPIAPPFAVEPQAPPALPLADDAALEQAAAAVLALSRPDRAEPRLFADAEVTDPSLAAPQGGFPARAPAGASPAQAAPASGTGAPDGQAKPESPAAEPPLPMIDLSAPAPAPRRSRGPSQQWFAPEERGEPETRGRLLLFGALVLALIVFALLLRNH